MDGGGAEGSARARARETARERREERARLRSDILDLVVSGYAYETIADKLKLSVKTVRRATAGAIEKRRLAPGAHYVHLQVLRLTKALRVVDLNLEQGDLKAVEPMLKVIAQLGKYHAPSRPRPPRRRSRFARPRSARDTCRAGRSPRSGSTAFRSPCSRLRSTTRSALVSRNTCK